MAYRGRGSKTGDSPQWDGSNWVSANPLPEGGEDGEQLTRIKQASDFQGPQQVTTTTGTDLWTGSNPWFGLSFVASNSNAVYSLDGGATWTTQSFSVGGAEVYTVTDSSTGRSFLIAEQPSGAGSGVEPVGSSLYEITNLDPLTVSGTPITITNVAGTQPVNTITAIAAPGNGRLYIAGTVNTLGLYILEYDIGTDATLQEHSNAGAPASQIAVDLDTVKYGDGFGRVFWMHQQSGFSRASLQDITTAETANSYSPGPSPGGASGWGADGGGFYVDGANNCAYSCQRNFNDGTLYLVKFSLEPYLSEVYVTQVDSDTNYSVASLTFDPATNQVFVLYLLQGSSWPGTTQSRTYVAVLTDTGSALTLDQTLEVAERYGQSHRTGALQYAPKLNVIGGKVYIPLNGGNNSDFTTRQNNFLTLDTSNPTSLEDPLTGTGWAGVTGGDLEENNGLIEVGALQGTDLFPGTTPPATTGGVIRYVDDTTDHFEVLYPRYFRNLSGSGITHNLAGNYDGVRLDATGFNTLNITDRADTPTQDGDYSLFISDVGGDLGFISSDCDIVPQGGRLIYGVDGSSGGVASYKMNACFESVELGWDDQNQQWFMANRWRPWRDLLVQGGVSTDVRGSHFLVHVNTGNSTNSTTITLNSSPQHMDEIIVFDEDGLASSRPITVATPDGLNGDPSADKVIDRDYGVAHLMFNGPQNTWIDLNQLPPVEGSPYPGGNLAMSVHGIGPSASRIPPQVINAQIDTSAMDPTTGIMTNGRYIYVTSSDNNGRIVALSPGSRDPGNAGTEFIYEYDFPSNSEPQGAMWDGTYIWTANLTDNSVSQFNEDLTLVGTYAHNIGGFNPRFILSADGAGIVVVGDGGLSRRTPGGTWNTASFGETIFDAAYDGQYVWIVWPGAGQMNAYSVAAAGVPQLIYSVTGLPTQCRGIAFDGTYMWTQSISTSSAPGTLVRVNVLTQTLETFTPDLNGDNFLNNLTYDGRVLWCDTDSGIVFINPANGTRIIQNTALGGSLSPSSGAHALTSLSEGVVGRAGGTSYQIYVQGGRLGAFTGGLHGPNGEVRSHMKVFEDTLNEIPNNSTVNAGPMASWRILGLKGDLAGGTKVLDLNNEFVIIDNNITNGSLHLQTTSSVNTDETTIYPGKYLAWAETVHGGTTPDWEVDFAGSTTGINPDVYTNADTGAVLPNTGGVHVIHKVDTTGGAVTLNEPAVRKEGMQITLVDVGGDAVTNNITFVGTGVIGTNVISTNNGSRTWQWDLGASQWLPIASA